MAPIPRTRFARLLRGLSPDEFVSFVADLWAARGWTTDVRGDAVIATREASTADRHVLLVRHAAPRLDRVQWNTDRTDATHVVTSGNGSAAANESADSLGANVVDRSDLYDMAVYALDTGVRESLFQRHFDRSATAAEPSGVVATSAAQLRTPRGKLVAIAIVLVLFAAASGALSLRDDGARVSGTTGGDGPRIVTPTPEPFSISDASLTPDTPTPDPGGGSSRVTYYGPASDVTPGSGDAAWAMFRGDPGRTGHRPGTVGPRDEVGIMAQFDAEFGIVSSPAVVDGTVYVGAVDGVLYALDARSLYERWTRYLDGAILSSPAVVGETVYVGSTSAMSPGFVSNETDRMHAIDTSRGRTAWNASTGAIATSSPAVVNGSVYVGASNGRVYALHPENGSIRWNASTRGRVDSSPAVANGTVYVGSQDGHVYALDADDGSIRWRTSTNDSVISTPAVANGTVYVGSQDGRVYALDDDDGTITWQYSTDDAVVSSPAIANGTAFVGSHDGRVYSIDAVSGHLQWAYQTDGGVIASPAVANGTVYVSSLDGRVYALGAGSGDERWSYDLGSEIESSPAVTNGVLYVGTNGGTVYALAERSPE